MWDGFVALSASGLESGIVEIGGGDGVFAVRGQQLALRGKERELSALFSEASVTLETVATALLEGASLHSNETLGLSVQSFDQGRVLLAVISVIVATLAAWLWVGNAIVRRLSRLSERMRNMARGDLETRCRRSGATKSGSRQTRWSTSGSRRWRFSVSTSSRNYMGNCERPTRNCSGCRPAWWRRRSWRRWANWCRGWPTRSATR